MSTRPSRAVEMIREVGGGGGLRLSLGGPRGKGSPGVSKGPKPPIPTTILIAGKQSKRSKKGPFCYILGSPGSHSGNGINGARRGISLPVPPVSPAMRPSDLRRLMTWAGEAHGESSVQRKLMVSPGPNETYGVSIVT